MPLPDPLPHPEFAPSVDVRIAQASLDLLRANAALAAWARAIEAYEVEDLIASDTLAAPSLAQVLSRTDEERRGTTNRLTTEIYVCAVTALDSRVDRDAWLRQRVLDHVKAIYAAAGGVLLDAEGRRLTEAILTFNRVAPVRIGSGAFVLTALRILFASNIREATREFVE